MAAQTPEGIKSFWLLFFKEVTAFCFKSKRQTIALLQIPQWRRATAPVITAEPGNRLWHE
jgi:hypothetical protein